MKRILSLFSLPTAAQVVKVTLAEYERKLITAEADAAYSKKLSEFYREGIVRLRQQHPA